MWNVPASRDAACAGSRLEEACSAPAGAAKSSSEMVDPAISERRVITSLTPCYHERRRAAIVLTHADYDCFARCANPSTNRSISSANGSSGLPGANSSFIATRFGKRSGGSDPK